MSRGAEWEATDCLVGTRKRSSQLLAVTQGLLLNQLEGDLSISKMSSDSIAPTLEVKTPQPSEPSAATPPAARPRRNAKGKVLRAASSLAPGSQSHGLEEQSQENFSQISKPEADDGQMAAMSQRPEDVEERAGKRKKVLRAASDLAPGSCVGTQSLKSPFGSFDGCSQPGDICHQEPPVETAAEKSGAEAEDACAADMTPPTIPGFPPLVEPEPAMAIEHQNNDEDHSPTPVIGAAPEVTLTLADVPASTTPHEEIHANGLPGKRKRVLRAASDLAPGSHVGTQSFKSLHGSFDGCSQHGDTCTKDPPAETAVAPGHEVQDANTEVLHREASNSVGPAADILMQPAEEKVVRQCVDQAETQAWFGSEAGIPQAASNQLRSSCTAETELEGSQSQEAGEVPPDISVDAHIPQDSKALSVATPMEAKEKEASQEKSCEVTPAPFMGQADARSEPAVHRPVQKTHLKYRLFGKQTVRNGSTQRLPAASCLRSGSTVARARIGHTLDPPERGFLVRVRGDGWGGAVGGGYLATVTEADAETFTVIRRGDCHGSWDETHVLRSCCAIVARTNSKEHVFLSATAGRGSYRRS